MPALLCRTGSNCPFHMHSDLFIAKPFQRSSLVLQMLSAGGGADWDLGGGGAATTHTNQDSGGGGWDQSNGHDQNGGGGWNEAGGGGGGGYDGGAMTSLLCLPVPLLLGPSSDAPLFVQIVPQQL